MHETRQRILNVALDLFSKQGFHGTSIREIAEGVGIQKSSIYNHFDSKEKILEELTISIGPKLLKKRLNEAIKKKKIDTPYMYLQYLAKEILYILMDEREQKLMQIMIREQNLYSVRKVVQEKILKEDKDIIAEGFSKLMIKGLIRKSDPSLLTNEFLGSIIIIWFDYLIFGYKELNIKDYQQKIKNHVEFFWQAICIK